MDAGALEVVLHDFAFGALPATAIAGAQITVVNRAERERHELVVFHLPDREVRSVEELAALSPPELISTLGEPTTVLLTQPGRPTIAAVGDGVLTGPGRYALICFNTVGLAPAGSLEAAPGGGDGPKAAREPSRVVNGMYAELIVE